MIILFPYSLNYFSINVCSSAKLKTPKTILPLFITDAYVCPLSKNAVNVNATVYNSFSKRDLLVRLEYIKRSELLVTNIDAKKLVQERADWQIEQVIPVKLKNCNSFFTNFSIHFNTIVEMII